MKIFYEFYQNFNNRELALIIWTTILLIVTISKKSIYQPLMVFIRLLFCRRFVIIYMIMGFYLYLILSLVALVNPIYIFDLKDFMLWVLTIGLYFVFKTNSAKSFDYFYPIVIKTWQSTAIFELVINFYSFSLITELILLPFLVIILLLSEVLKKNKSNKMQFPINLILFIIAFLVLVFCFFKITSQPNSFFTANTLNSFLTPALMSTFYMPFLYFLGLYNIYASFFQRLSLQTRDKQTQIMNVKINIVKVANFNIDKLVRIQKNFDKKVFYEPTNFKEYIKLISL
jgi:hypothetical protein